MCTVDVGDRHRHLEVSLGLELLPCDLHSNQIADANRCRSRKIYVSVRFRRGAGAVEQAGLENRSGGNSTVGSNPTLSARVYRRDNKLRVILKITHKITHHL